MRHLALEAMLFALLFQPPVPHDRLDYRAPGVAFAPANGINVVHPERRQ